LAGDIHPAFFICAVMRKQFYEKVLPSQGLYCVAGIDKNKRTYHHFVETLDEVDSAINQVQEEGQNVFVALNTFRASSRLAEYASYCRSFFIDLDVDPENSKKYVSKDEALASLADFVKITELPPPVRVDSGNGIHAYWILDRDVPTAEWKLYATKFKLLCLDYMKIDTAVTADASRILRCPDTLHLKGEPKLTKLLDTDYPVYDFDMFKEYLGEVQEDITSILAAIPRGLDEDTKAIAKVDNFESLFQDIAEKSLGGSGCAQIKEILTNAVTLEEPMWYAGLSIARHCADWETAIHLMSEDHRDYNYENTIKKANQAFSKPFGCDKFEELNPKGCEGCSFKGHITNPLSIGRRLKEALTIEDTSQDAVRIAADSKAILSFPSFLRPYVRGVNGGVYYAPSKKPTRTNNDSDEDDEDDDEGPRCISVNDLAPIKRMFSIADGECLMMRHVMPHDPTREFILPMKSVYAIDRLKEALSSNSVAFLPTNAVYLMNYLIKWCQYLQSKDKAEIMRMQMGWTENNEAFVIGTNEICKDGVIRKAAASPLVRNISKLLKPVGSYDAWKTSANALNEEGFEMHAFAMLCGFGSPLMRLTSTSGVCVSYFSSESGNAKTGALYAGLSVFGDPKETSIVDGNSTDNAFIGRLLNLKNVMLGIDEASNARPEDISRLAHRISQGKAKMRMQSSVNAERDLEMTASLIAMFTTNQALYDKLVQLKASPDGEVARIIEFDIKRPDKLTQQLGVEIFDTFRHNYGHAGPEFIQYFYKVGEEYVKTVVNKWLVRFKRDFGDDVAYRFYENLISAVFGAGELAVEAGIIDINLERIYTKIVSEVMDLRDNTIKLAPNDYKTLLGEFCNDNQSKFLIFDGERMVNQYDPKQLIGRIEMDTNTYYITRSIFKKFLAERNISASKFEMIAKKENLLIGSDRKRLGSGWKGGASFQAVWTYVFRSNALEGLIKDLIKLDDPAKN